MPNWGQHARADAAPDSHDFAVQLRSGPIRTMIDRVVRSAAELVGVPCMVLGIRYGDYYEFISTHGIPLSHYSDRVPARLLGTKLFAREVEVADLQKQAQFTALSIAPIAKLWRYGGNCPVRIGQRLGDDGVLALSCADTQRHDTGGPILGVLRAHAEFISDLISLSGQIERHGLVADPGSVVASVLQAGVAQFRKPICILDSQQQVIGVSETFNAASRALGGASTKLNERLRGNWLTPFVEKAMSDSLEHEKSKQWLPIGTTDKGSQLLDLFPFSFPGLGKFMIVSLHDGSIDGHASPQLLHLEPQKTVFADSARDRDDADGPGPVSRFLDETLVRLQKLHRRNETTYVGVRRWRSAIKSHQIAALQALKSDPPPAFVRAIVDELADAVRTVYGSTEACVVVPVPCGHSGPGCLSARLAAGLAAKLDIPMVNAFAPLEKGPGKSHPRRNSSRPSMRLEQTIDQPVILVDDVATSGSHIDEAATLLRQSAASVWSVAWIAP